MKRVLIISYYWPPSGGIGVHRCLKYAKYLRNFGWEPVILTAKNPDYPVLDEGNFKDVPNGVEVLKSNIWEPYNIFKTLIGKKKEEKIHNVLITEKEPGLLYKFGIWIRGNFFIPDARRFWIKPSIKLLSEYLKEHPVDAMFTNGPPQSTHLIAYGIKKKFNIPWIADFQDPWTQVDYYQKFKIGFIADKIHKRLEQNVLKTADKTIICSNTWKKDLESIGAKNVSVLVWGYDEEDFKNIKTERTQKFRLSHFGSLGPDRNPPNLWKALSDIANENKSFAENLEIELVGFIDHSIIENLKKLGLEKNIIAMNHIPRNETLIKMHQTQVLLLILNDAPNVKGRLPGKLFEYLASRRPVWVIGPTDSDAAEIVYNANAGTASDFEDIDSMKKTILNFYNKYLNNKLDDNKTNLDKYTNKNLTKQLAGYLDELVNK